MRRIPLLTILIPALLALAGCRSIGPDTVARDRFDYSSSITDSWKRQSLLNIVKLRYLDPPIYVDVGQIVASYQMEIAGGVTGLFGHDSQNHSVSGRVEGRYIDRPTITYTPMTGSKFVAGLITPIPPAAFFAAIQSGWSAESMLNAGVSSINGIQNDPVAALNQTTPDTRFERVATLMERLQRSGAVAIRVSSDPAKQGGPLTLLVFHSGDIPPEVSELSAELRSLLRLNPTAKEFRVVTGGLPSNDTEIAIQTRSLLHVTHMMAVHAEVPAADVTDGRALPGATDASPAKRGIRIHSSKDQPKDAFASVRYRDNWFWIDDRDPVSKRAFSLLMLLFTMTDTSGEGRPPVLTIST